jgi:hypothetical protein
VNFNPDGWSDAAHDELMPMLMVKNAMAWVAIWKMGDLCIRRLIFAWHRPATLSDRDSTATALEMYARLCV